MEHNRATFPMPYPHIILCLLCLTTLTSLSSSSSNPNSITLPLSPFYTNHPSSDPFQSLKLAASASLTRAHHLKHRNTTTTTTSSVTTEVHPKSYGGYSIDLQFGTPPQTSSFVLDTGSSLVWFPCSSRYLCSSCSFPNIDPTKIPKFIPKNSTSSKLLSCTNPKCGLVFGSNVESRCRGCNPETQNCTDITCPTYILQYGLGSTAGLLLSENLDFPSLIVPDFIVGCSLLSIRQPSGIAGFGRGLESLPSQMGLKRFSYCLVSHNFDDSTENSDLVLQIGTSGGRKTGGLSYTPFRKNPEGNSVFREYYYVSLKKIVVGGKRVKVPIGLLEPGADGNGGTIVDSGSTFTFMERPVFELVAEEFEKQMKNFTRAKEVETQSGLSPCFNVDAGDGDVALPEFTFGFKGGAKMALPAANYFSFVGSDNVVCLTIVSDGAVGPARAGGPAIILGNYQQQNYYVEYDLENERFGFGPRTCSKGT
ncbi:hypothetical protein RIF29_39667 [Crotalaria pallida]|uniref:Peptidase A1 domain-containing protein n=1 Tax=Crotalaria pallida TaxID=3830 RepID=A0AAN9E260_CROPI